MPTIRKPCPIRNGGPGPGHSVRKPPSHRPPQQNQSLFLSGRQEWRSPPANRIKLTFKGRGSSALVKRIEASCELSAGTPSSVLYLRRSVHRAKVSAKLNALLLTTIIGSIALVSIFS